ncbi:MAG: 2Fe-2S iron-sulfur cluster-binding protein, partial [Alphaproteobacteria bacterium]
MTGSTRRLPSGGSALRRDRTVRFTFDGQAYQGFEGDTLASALLANGVEVIGRSFRYHRPRGLWGEWVEEPAAIVDVVRDGRAEPNAKATLVPLADGLVARSVNRWPSLRFDAGAVVDLLHPVFPAGFYYKTFMRPGWHAWEPTIRARAGLGRVDPAAEDHAAPMRWAHCDVLVVGGGPAGLAAARAAAAGDARVIVVEDRARLGGGLDLEAVTIGGVSAHAWIAAVEAELRARAEVMMLAATTAFGYFDHNLVGLAERTTGGQTRVWHVRARRVVLATGAIERPLVFPDNDRPGIMSAAAALAYLRRYGVLAGREVVVVTDNDSAYGAAVVLTAAGARVAAIVDARPDPDGVAT